jgi:hypothetical protein
LHQEEESGKWKVWTNGDVLQVLQVVLDETRGKDWINASFSSVELGCQGEGPVAEGSRHSMVDGRPGDTLSASLDSDKKFTSYMHRYAALRRSDCGHVYASCSSRHYHFHPEDDR